MSGSQLQQEWESSYLSGGSMAYVDSLYEDYLSDPSSVSEEWKQVFDALPKVNGQRPDTPHRKIRDYFLQRAHTKRAKASSSEEVSQTEVKQSEVTHLINAYRTYGHLVSKLDPLDMAERPPVASLELSYHNLSEEDWNKSFFAGDSFVKSRMPLSEICSALKKTYCSSIGIEYMHIANTEERQWLQQQLESVQGQPEFEPKRQLNILQQLIAAEGLERY